MSKFTKGTTLYKTDDRLGVIKTKPGTEAEYRQRLLEGWSTTKPKSETPARTPEAAAPSGGKKN